MSPFDSKTPPLNVTVFSMLNFAVLLQKHRQSFLVEQKLKIKIIINKNKSSRKLIPENGVTVFLTVFSCPKHRATKKKRTIQILFQFIFILCKQMLQHLSFVCNVFYLAKYLFKFVSAMLEKWLAISKVKFMSLVDSFGYNLMKAIFYHSSCKFHYLNTPISETNLLSKYLFYGSTFAIFLLYRIFSSLSIFLFTLYYYANIFFNEMVTTCG